MSIPVEIVLIVVALLVGIGVAFPLGMKYRQQKDSETLGTAQKQAKDIINDALKAKERSVREAMVESKEQIHKDRQEFDRELRDRRRELQSQEKRLMVKEENYDRKLDNLEKKEETLQKKHQAAEAVREEAEKLKQSQMDILERISGFSVEEAKVYMLKNLEDELVHESAQKIRNIEEKTKDEADEKARGIIGLSIARIASDYVAESTVSVVHLPNDEMKGRVIGREGRNVRTLEQLIGVDLIIDDTPDVITISAFDAVRRETARLALNKLILDGRINPTRIEEYVEKARREIEQTMRAEGDKATFETGVHGLPRDLINLLGRMKYRTSYSQNVLQHSIEVALFSGIMAAELGVDVMTAKRAGLLHDIGKSIDHDVEGSHVVLGVDLAKKYKESKEIIHAIEAHHNDVEPKTVLACIVQAADAISAARPGARRENIENYIKRLEKLEELACSFEGVERTFAVQAGREIRVMVRPEIISDDQMTILGRDLAKKIETDLQYPGQIKIHLMRETRHIAYAK